MSAKSLPEELEEVEKEAKKCSTVGYKPFLKIFRTTVQDKALNKSTIEFEAFSWADAIVTALERKRAEQKLLMIEYVRDSVRYV